MKLDIYEDLANKGMGAKELAQLFLKNYFKDKEIVYPINPFKILKDLNVNISFRDFSKAEGIYIPASNEDDLAIVGINLNRCIQRQRYTAAHELCHHLKDRNSNCVCKTGSRQAVEKYAENFASEILMPSNDFKNKVDKFINNNSIDDDDILKIAQYFGVSFEACMYKIAYDLNMASHLRPTDIKRHTSEYSPKQQKLKLHLFDTTLYKQLFDTLDEMLSIKPSKFACEVFKSQYIFEDSRMEGVNIGIEEAGDIVADLRLNKQNSKYCKEENENIIQIAGLSFVFDYIFENAKKDISIYDSKQLNKTLYSTAPCTDDLGQYRKTNTLVKGAKFETIDYSKIPAEMMYLGNDVDELLGNNSLSVSEYIETIARIHYRMTVIHPFQDGNGRTSRAFSNMLLVRKDIPPIFFTSKTKTEYKKALKFIDEENIYDLLYESFYKSIIKSSSIFITNIN